MNLEKLRRLLLYLDYIVFLLRKDYDAAVKAREKKAKRKRRA